MFIRQTPLKFFQNASKEYQKVKLVAVYSKQGSNRCRCSCSSRCCCRCRTHFVKNFHFHKRSMDFLRFPLDPRNFPTQFTSLSPSFTGMAWVANRRQIGTSHRLSAVDLRRFSRVFSGTFFVFVSVFFYGKLFAGGCRQTGKWSEIAWSLG